MMFSSGSMGKSGGLITFGQQAVGANIVALSRTIAYRTLFTCPAAGRLTTISFYAKGSAANGDICIGIYDGLVLLGHVSHSMVAGEAAAWHDVDFSPLAIDLTNKVYGLAMKPMASTIASCYFAAADANQSEQDTLLVGADHLPNPYAHDLHEERKWSIHADVLT